MTSFVLAYGDQRIPYQVAFDDNRSTRVAIHVNPDGSVTYDQEMPFADAM
ncbi:MAG: hypothetical protein AAGA08_18985 [Pseudomonadota bacterium]